MRGGRKVSRWGPHPWKSRVRFAVLAPSYQLGKEERRNDNVLSEKSQMDWSLIVLLFAAGFALAGLAFLIATVHKVMRKQPTSLNIPPSAATYPCSQPQPAPQPAYTWSLNGGLVQKLALGQGSGGREAPSLGRELAPMSGAEEGEYGCIQITCSTVSARIPVFEPEPVNRAERVPTVIAPHPDSVAVPVENELVPEPDAIAIQLARLSRCCFTVA